MVCLPFLRSRSVLPITPQAGYALKGGPSKLPELVRKCLLLAVPPFLVGSLSRALDQGARVIPSPTTVRRNEFIFDLALLQYRRLTFRIGMRRYMLIDSSPGCNHDWVWVIVHEIKDDDLVPVAIACAKLNELIGAFMESLAAKKEIFDWTQHVRAVPSDWVEACKVLLKVEEYIYPPGSVTTGHRSTVHKAGVMAHVFHLDTPQEEDLDEYCKTFQTSTSDMGIEMGAGDIEVEEASRGRLKGGCSLDWRHFEF